jgi:hypothetical protein
VSEQWRPDGETTDAPTPRHLPRRRWLAIGLIVLAVLVYAAVVTLYASNSRVSLQGLTEPGATAADPCPDTLLIVLTPESVSGTSERISMNMQVCVPDKYLQPDSPLLAQSLNLVVSPIDGEQTVALEKGTIPPSTSISIVAPGTVENWPFDRYEANFIATAYTTSADGQSDSIPTDVSVNGSLSGWKFAAAVGNNPDIATLPTIDLTASRSGSTLAFGVVLLGLMIVMPTLVLFVAINVFRGRRKVESTTMSWMGAMLFATIPLRGFLPGSPPIGSWIDYLIVLWVIVALVAGLAIFIAGWRRWGSPSPGWRARSPEEEKRWR